MRSLSEEMRFQLVFVDAEKYALGSFHQNDRYIQVVCWCAHLKR